ncbi:MAG: TIGR00153 family protein [Gammaproteobacteria bacterium]|nr:TIGR00153 family protein [Gammaproteobacteria bacterium]
MAVSTPAIVKMFGQSPFKPLQEHMKAVLECVREVPGLFEALNNGDQEGVKVIKDRIFEKEDKADVLKNQLRDHLPKGLFMAVDRRDLLEILQLQDSIADTAQDIAGLLVERPMEVPDPLRKPLVELTRRCIDTCEHLGKIIAELDELVDAGFRGREATQVEAMVAELNKIEDETDEMGLKLARLLFEHEDDIKPVSVVMWYRLIEWIGDLADYAEKVGDRQRLLIAS